MSRIPTQSPYLRRMVDRITIYLDKNPAACLAGIAACLLLVGFIENI